MKKLKVIAIILIISFFCTFFSGCSKSQRKTNEFLVVTSFYPMYVFTKNITEGAKNVKVINMTKPQTGCLHDYQLLPKDIKVLEDADAFVINGGGMESFMEKVYENISGLNVITAAEGIKLLPTECEEHHEHSHEHGHQELNSHVWTYIPYAIEQIENIAKGLSFLNPENKDVYSKNTKEYVKGIKVIHEEFKKFSSKNNDIKMVVTHEAFDYMAHGYGFEICAHIMDGHNMSPSAAELTRLVDIINTENVTGIFKEIQYSGEIADTLKNETDKIVYELNAMVTGDDEYTGVYEKVMKGNLEVLKNTIR